MSRRFCWAASWSTCGMLAFLYYDSHNLGRGQDITTGNVGPIETRALPAAPNAPIPQQSVAPVDLR